ncbi:glycosyl hydrolase [Thalassotalea mangrovi]|uniref:Mannan endo-1,4-beta-mannosidase n=1 Tax=Thalassotalea mangrovi TaxID=2572245 RepID=A0A4U1B1Y8_9GAMM|nr:glycosyl hydrolase [Thalassotalea mangrovi]TKB43544.1 mannan endo-1,4-beta-mannosidase [Thalassotalea mangrovi]
MKVNTGLKSAKAVFIIALLTGGLVGCVDESELNTDTVTYQPEERPLGVLAGEDAEYAPGSTVIISGRLTGTVTDQTLLWSQIEGSPINIADPTMADLTFIAPNVEALESFTFQLAAIGSDGNVINDGDGNPLVDDVTITVFDPAKLITLEAEDSSVATLSGAVTIVGEGDEQYVSGHSGTGHTSDITPGDKVSFNVDLETGGYYTVYLNYTIGSGYGGKVGQVITNGVTTDLSLSETGKFEQIRVGVFNMNTGTNTIEVGGGWNYYRVDNIQLLPAAAPAVPLKVEPQLVNVNASQQALALMEFIAGNYGTATLSGQTEFPRKTGNTFELNDFNAVTEATGDDAPAIVAFDYMNYSASYQGEDPSGLTEAMLAHHQEKNIILSALFHWRAPSGNDGEGSFYTDGTTFDVAAALADPNSAEYAELLNDIDTVAMELKKLADADVPVLWRPLHEAEGGWFWWGAKGSDAFKELWMLMYDRMTNTHGLNNLIWVFTHTHGLSQDWYPGDDYVDIVGFDGYADPANDPNATFSGQYSTLKERHNGKKLVALTETGTIPDVSKMHEQNAWWAFFITWNSEYWDSSSVIGPQGADAATIDMNYAYEGLVNLDDVPGGRTKVEAGLYTSFEPVALDGWEAQVNWSPTDGLTTSSDWSASGATSLAVIKDMTAIDSPENIVLQTYPAEGFDVSNAVTMTIYANAIDAGMPNVHVFVKHADGESWPDPINLNSDGVAFPIDVSGIDTLTGFGVRFQNLDITATQAQYLIDKITLTDSDGNETVAYDFEPDTDGWHAQVAWSNVSGITTSEEWATSGARSLALYKNLAAHGAANDVVLQNYPEGGFDVTGKSTLTLKVNSIGAGDMVDAHIFFKAPDGVESWPAAVAIGADGTELTIDVSQVDTLDGLGVRFNGVDAASDNARFFIDEIRVDGALIADFEGTGNWEFQVNWAPVGGIQLSKAWSDDGMNSLSGITQLVDGDDDIILQVYPEGGLLLGDVSTLKVTAYVMDAGDGVQVQLFAKDKDFAWRDGGAVDMVDGGVTLSLDIADMSEMSGFGVRFMGPVNSDTPSQYFIDNVVFE